MTGAGGHGRRTGRAIVRRLRSSGECAAKFRQPDMKQQAVTSLTLVCGIAPACLEPGRWRRIPAQVPGSRQQTLE